MFTSRNVLIVSETWNQIDSFENYEGMRLALGRSILVHSQPMEAHWITLGQSIPLNSTIKLLMWGEKEEAEHLNKRQGTKLAAPPPKINLSC